MFGYSSEQMPFPSCSEIPTQHCVTGQTSSECLILSLSKLMRLIKGTVSTLSVYSPGHSNKPLYPGLKHADLSRSFHKFEQKAISVVNNLNGRHLQSAKMQSFRQNSIPCKQYTVYIFSRGSLCLNPANLEV